MIYRDCLPTALAFGRYIAALGPKVVGHGLEALQAAVDARRAVISGIS